MTNSAVKHKSFRVKHKTNGRQAQDFNSGELYKALIHDAEVVGIAHGAAEMMANRIIAAVDQWLNQHETVTSGDLQRQIIKEAKKYNADLAYAYQNRGKII